MAASPKVLGNIISPIKIFKRIFIYYPIKYHFLP